jgi:hypothetical protein
MIWEWQFSFARFEFSTYGVHKPRYEIVPHVTIPLQASLILKFETGTESACTIYTLARDSTCTVGTKHYCASLRTTISLSSSEMLRTTLKETRAYVFQLLM